MNGMSTKSTTILDMLVLDIAPLDEDDDDDDDEDDELAGEALDDEPLL